MIKIIVLIIAATFIIAITGIFSKANNDWNESGATIYQFSAVNIDGEEISLEDYKGKVVLVVNVASKCGYTKHYKSLQALYEKYKERGFEILAFPCNQFGAQEPGTNEEIKEFCSTNFNVTFQLFDKIDVNGENAHPLYKHLTSQKGGLINDAIKWNFTKFLIAKNGLVEQRFAPQTEPKSLEQHIERLLAM